MLLERQRLQTLGKTAPAAQLTSIKRNMEVMREGILELERQALSTGAMSSFQASGTATEARKAVEQLRAQWQRARRMLGEEGTEIEE